MLNKLSGMEIMETIINNSENNIPGKYQLTLSSKFDLFHQCSLSPFPILVRSVDLDERNAFNPFVDDFVVLLSKPSSDDQQSANDSVKSVRYYH
jgi:hypothetical protein